MYQYVILLKLHLLLSEYSFYITFFALMEENDLQLQIQKYKMENMKLKEEIVEKNKKIVELKEKLLES